MNKKLYIFDVDGTLVETKSGATFRKTAGDWQWLPGRIERLRELEAQGAQLAIATNQGGVAYGYYDEDAMQSELARMSGRDQTGLTYGPALYVCYAHPDASIERYREYETDLFDRKPLPGMLFKAMLAARVTVLETVFVGDREDDEQAAKNAGIEFMWAKDFFSAEKEVPPQE